MSYNKKTWANGDDVTPADFNRIEQGIKDNEQQINNLSDERGYKTSKYFGENASIDWDTIIDNGLYDVNGWDSNQQNVPVVMGVMAVRAFWNNITQTIYGNDEMIYYRVMPAGGSWSAWMTVNSKKVTLTLLNGWKTEDDKTTITAILNGNVLTVVGSIKATTTAALDNWQPIFNLPIWGNYGTGTLTKDYGGQLLKHNFTGAALQNISDGIKTINEVYKIAYTFILTDGVI